MHLGLFWGPVRGTLGLSGTAKTVGGFAPEPLRLYFEGLQKKHKPAKNDGWFASGPLWLSRLIATEGFCSLLVFILVHTTLSRGYQKTAKNDGLFAPEQSAVFSEVPKRTAEAQELVQNARRTARSKNKFSRKLFKEPANPQKRPPECHIC